MSPGPAPIPLTLESTLDRLTPRIEIAPTGCWLWTGPVDKSGYGRWSGPAVRDKALSQHVHRAVFELAVHAIPDGLHLDHLCRTPPCVNPGHLEPVTPGENTLRGVSPVAVNATKTHCVHGHEFDESNTRLVASPHGGTERACRRCANDAQRRYRERQRAVKR